MNNNQNNNVEQNNSSINDTKQNEIINPNDEINSKMLKKKNLLKYTCIILSVIIGIIGFILGIFTIIQSIHSFNIFAFFWGLFILFMTINIIITIWTIYNKINTSEKNNSSINDIKQNDIINPLNDEINSKMLKKKNLLKYICIILSIIVGIIGVIFCVASAHYLGVALIILFVAVNLIITIWVIYNAINPLKENNNSINDIKQNDIINPLNDEVNSNQPKKKNLFAKICIILSIIVGIIGYGYGIFNIIQSFSISTNGMFGGLEKNLTVVLGLWFLLGTTIIIISIWFIYRIITFISKFYNKLNPKKKKNFKISLIIIMVVLLISAFSLAWYKYENKNLAEVLNQSPSDHLYTDTNYYFIYKDKIYYYKLDINNIFNKMHDKLFVMNLDGTHNKKLVESDELRYAYFYFVYNDEAYFYSVYYNENKKVNLNTGEISSLGTDDTYIAKTLNNGIVYSFIDYRDYSKFRKIDLDNNKIISEIKTNYSMYDKKFYFDYGGFNIYYLENNYSQFPSIYKNNQLIYEFTGYDKSDFPEIEFIAANNDYIYFEQKSILYKLNINDKIIEKEININLNVERINSGNNTDNYFYYNNKIYSFNTQKENFELIISDVEKQPEYVYNINNKLIFTKNTNNIKYNIDKDNFGSVLIYDKQTNNIEKYDDIYKASFDENFMYLLYRSRNNYSVKKINI